MMFEDNGNKCGKCQNHEFEVLKKGHARDCPFKKCECLKCRLLDARSDILQVISGKETKLKGTKKDPNCGFCQNHGIKILRKGHVRSCGFGQERHFKLDNCFDCEVHYIRNEVNRLQIKMRRAMKEDRTLSEEQRKTAREAITRDEVEKVCDMARVARKKRESFLSQQVGESSSSASSTNSSSSSLSSVAANLSSMVRQQQQQPQPLLLPPPPPPLSPASSASAPFVGAHLVKEEPVDLVLSSAAAISGGHLHAGGFSNATPASAAPNHPSQYQASVWRPWSQQLAGDATLDYHPNQQQQQQQQPVLSYEALQLEDQLHRDQQQLQQQQAISSTQSYLQDILLRLIVAQFASR